MSKEVSKSLSQVAWKRETLVHRTSIRQMQDFSIYSTYDTEKERKNISLIL